MNRITNIKITSLVSIVFLLLVGGCARDYAYRTNYSPCLYVKSGDCIENSIQQTVLNDDEEYGLSFVEFNDQGQLRHREQLQAVLDNYYNIASDNDVLLIVFVHGWHHNASPDDKNINQFRGLLSRISKIETKAKRKTTRKVLGLYIGWRGESITVPLVNTVTFWSRKSTAQDVGLHGVTEVLLKMEEIVNVKVGTETLVPKPNNSRLVVIGHSFGGAVVFTSLQQVLADRYIDSKRNKTFTGDANGFGDLVMLVNPAFEALRFATLYDISQNGCRRYFSTQLPKLAILTSESDYATKIAFPLGRFFSTFFESHTTLDRTQCGDSGATPLLVDEGKADRTTVGHFDPYVTHILTPSKSNTPRDLDFNYLDFRNSWAEQKDKGVVFFEGSDLTHLGKSRPLNPYLNIKVDSDLIADHNDIWGDAVMSFMRDLIAISTLPLEK